MSKLSFRARQVDYTKPLPIYLSHDLPDLQDFAAINRSVPQMPTGMEKDEESEHHLQRALSALQAFGATSSNEYAIPTPKVDVDTKFCDKIYCVDFPRPKQYIRIQRMLNTKKNFFLIFFYVFKFWFFFGGENKKRFRMISTIPTMTPTMKTRRGLTSSGNRCPKTSKKTWPSFSRKSWTNSKKPPDTQTT